MKTLIAVVALSLVAGVAVAGEGNGDPFGYTAPARTISLQNYKQVEGSNQNPYPFSAGTTPMVIGQVLPSNGSAGEVQTANSLPAGFTDGVPGRSNVIRNAPAPNIRLAQPVAPLPGTHG